MQEATVIATKDLIKGEVPIGFVVLKEGSGVKNVKELEQELIHLMRHELGPIAFFKKCIVVKQLPKTRGEKVLRKVLRKIVEGKEFVIPDTVKDIKAIEEIVDIVKNVIID